ncbi:hypothetical protein CHS0354_028047 [Potamilus streckersoni]|uniref:Polycystin cation channel PKD1/PKD2 domain-containing protein n=1 Tax=Potamilus streckersoni TaxID=2493646 RepID=A0AAE0WEQ7_9BIVA|nr:hypothetical protein CHS0354_028047 [Potamilus streckersoni]
MEGLWLFCKRKYGILQRGLVKAKIPPSLLPKTRRAVMKLRRKLMWKSQTRLLITEMIIYFIFLVVVYVLALSSSDDRAYQLKHQIDNRLEFEKLNDQADFLEWMNVSFFDLYFPATVFDVQEVPHELKYFFIDFANVRVGPARLRQVRVKEELCAFGLIEKEMCFAEYQLTNEDAADYFIGWKDGRFRTEQVKEYTFTAWHHVSAFDIWGLPTSGNYNKKLYGGGGYIIKLDINRDVSEKIITELKENKWIDRGTRAVFLEFTLYNSNVNLFSFVKYVREYPEVGDVWSYSYVSTFRLYYDKDSYVICSFIFILFVVLLFLKICYDLYINGTYYFNALWNITDFIMFPLGIVSAGLLFFRQKMTRETVDKYHEDQNEYVNFEQLAFANSLLISLLAILLYYATLRLIRIQGRSKWFDRVLRVLQRARWDLTGFFIVFLIIFSSFISLGYLFFGRLVYEYRDPFTVLATLSRALLGQGSFLNLVKSSPNLAEFYYVTFVFLVLFCLITMATAILNASITLVKRKVTSYEEKGLDDIIYKLFGKFMAWFRRRNITRVKDIDHADILKG